MCDKVKTIYLFMQIKPKTNMYLCSYSLIVVQDLESIGTVSKITFPRTSHFEICAKVYQNNGPFEFMQIRLKM